MSNCAKTTNPASITAPDNDVSAIRTLQGELELLKRQLAQQNQLLTQQQAQLTAITARHEAPSVAGASTNANRTSRRAALGRVAALAALGLAAVTARPAAAGPLPPKKQVPVPPSGSKSPGRAPTVNELTMGVTNDAPTDATHPFGLQTIIQNPFSNYLSDPVTFLATQSLSLPATVQALIRNTLFSSYPGLNEPVSALQGAIQGPPIGGPLQSYAVVGYNQDGVGVAGSGRWPIQIVGQFGPPTSTDTTGQEAPWGVLYHQVGTSAIENALQMRFTYPAGSVWRRIATAEQLGVLIPTNQPIRVLDTRVGSLVGFNTAGIPIGPGPIAAGAVVGFRVAGQTFSGFTFPADTRGIFGTIFLIDSGPAGGFVTISSINPPSATTATITPNGAAPFIASSSALTQLDGAGSFWVRNVAAARDIGFDVSGYFV